MINMRCTMEDKVKTVGFPISQNRCVTANYNNTISNSIFMENKKTLQITLYRN